MNTLILIFLLFVLAAFVGLEVWFVVSLVQFIVAAARRAPNWKKKLGMFIAAAVCQVVVGSTICFTIAFAYLFNF